MIWPTYEQKPMKVRRIRTEKKMIQMELCHKISMEQKTLSAIENGRMEPYLKNIDYLVSVLGVTLARLFKDL